jgi:hypothetical protein
LKNPKYIFLIVFMTIFMLFCSEAVLASVDTEIEKTLKMTSEEIQEAGDKLELLSAMEIYGNLINITNTEYGQYYILRSKISFRKFQLIGLEHNHGSGLGCCAAPGIALSLKAMSSSDIEEIKSYAIINKCEFKSINDYVAPKEYLLALRLSSRPPEYVLNCKDSSNIRGNEMSSYINKAEALAISAELAKKEYAKSVEKGKDVDLKMAKKFESIMVCVNAKKVNLAFPDATIKIHKKVLMERINSNAVEKDSELEKGMVSCFAKLIDPIEIDDFRVDFGSYVGKPVRVNGLAQYLLNTLTLRRDIRDLSSVSIEIGSIPRDQKLEVLKKCGDIRGCQLSVFGTAKGTNILPQLVAIDIEIK